MKTQEKTAIKPDISFDDFRKADIRLCLITGVEKVENTDKLYKLTIDTGVGERTVLSAIAHQLPPGMLLNKKMPFILNIPPRKMKGIESHGMILMAESNNNFYILGNENAGVGSVII